jgi:CSLREA domain-containing protein
MAVAGLVWLVSPARAGSIAVTTTDDELNTATPCSLREAIRSANTDLAIGGCAAGSGADTITVPPGTYVLAIPNQPGVTDENNGQAGDLDILADLTIAGSSNTPTIIDGNGVALAGRVFDVSAAATVSFMRLTIRNGAVPAGSLAGGGGITNNGRATFTNTTITGNSAGTGGGGVSNGSGVGATSVFIDSTVSANSAGGSGGGVRNGSGASSTFTNTTISGNTAHVGGGGVSNDGLAAFTNATVSSNIAGGRGGGVFNGTPVATATFTNTTISGNTAQGEGGGISNGSGATATMVNSTVSGNRTSDSGGGVHGGATSLSNSTLTLNTADSDANGTGEGGGLALTALTTKNSVIGGNVDGSPSPAVVAPDCQAVVASQGYNLIGIDAGCSITPASGDKIGSGALPLDPGLAPLRNYGGPTATHALLASSPARNNGSPAASETGGDSCAAVDQRGVPRPQSSRCDMGAYEYASCLKAVVDRVGTSGNDSLGGTKGPDVFLGLGGKDRINARAGKDRACGGKGNDPLIGGSGADQLSGDEGADRVFGGAGSDRLMGGRGNDLLVGGPGRDRCVGGSGRDRAISCEKKIGIP